jgi:hypothetical protein
LSKYDTITAPSSSSSAVTIFPVKITSGKKTCDEDSAIYQPNRITGESFLYVNFQEVKIQVLKKKKNAV